MCESLRKLHGSTLVFPHLQSLLQHFLLLRDEHHWAFVDHMVQQIAIQIRSMGDPDIVALEMDVEKCCKVNNFASFRCFYENAITFTKYCIRKDFVNMNWIFSNFMRIIMTHKLWIVDDFYEFIIFWRFWCLLMIWNHFFRFLTILFIFKISSNLLTILTILAVFSRFF